MMLTRRAKRIAQLKDEALELRKENSLLREGYNGMFRDLETRTAQTFKLIEELEKVKADLAWAINYLRECGGCDGCKYEENDGTEEPCCRCQRVTLQKEDRWEFHGANGTHDDRKKE